MIEADGYHLPVMFEETLDLLVVDVQGLYIDGTFGGGGHTAGILERLATEGRVIGCDADRAAIERGGTVFSNEPRLVLRQGYVATTGRQLIDEGVRASGILLDLGVSSRQLDSRQIGLSYRTTMPLDMRFDQESDRITAAEIVNETEAGDLATLMRRYGDEPAAWTIARAIVAERKIRPIETTTDLRSTIAAVIPEPFLVKALSRVFQALRIVVNDELGELERSLEAAADLLVVGGRIVVLTYHSLEDRMVKGWFRDASRRPNVPPELREPGSTPRFRLPHRKPLLPSDEEIARYPRARSAKLRVAERIEDEE